MITIRDWDSHYETNETRKLKRLLWVKLPNQHDSLPYRTIASHARGPEIFAAWILMLQAASKQGKRGNLPMSPDELGLMTGFPAEIFKLAIEVLKSAKIGWIDHNPDAPGESPDVPGSSPENLPVEEGREGKGKEEVKTLVPVGTGSKRVASQQFQKPTFAEVEGYCNSRGNSIKPQAFLAFYESNGWRVGKNPMRNWKAAVVTWENKDRRP